MTRFLVYNTDELIGYGWLFHTEYGMTTPELFKSNGETLEQGWYTLAPYEDRLAVMTETIQ